LAVIPSPDISVECRGVIEHENHIGDVSGIPPLMFWLKAMAPENISPILGHIARVPSADILVECAAAKNI